MHGAQSMARAEQVIGLHERVPLIIQVTDQLIELRRGKLAQADPYGVLDRHRYVFHFPRASSRTAYPAGEQPRRQGSKPPASVENIIKPLSRLRGWPVLAMTQLR